MGDIIVGGILIAIIAAVITSMVRKKQAGKSLLCDSCESQDCCQGQCPIAEQTVEDLEHALDTDASDPQDKPPV